jgi:hypothetical protein
LRSIILAERAQQCFLVWLTDAGEQRLLLLEPHLLRVTIGRDAQADVSITWDNEVSRAHALLERVGGRWILVDDGLSRNGSFVNDVRVLGRRRLSDHDRMRVGSTHILYRDMETATTDSTASIRAKPGLPPLSQMQRRVLIALCRPVFDSESATPATNRQIAAEVFLTVDAVKAHLRVLFERYQLTSLPQNEKRARLVAETLQAGVLSRREFRVTP